MEAKREREEPKQTRALSPLLPAPSPHLPFHARAKLHLYLYATSPRARRPIEKREDEDPLARKPVALLRSCKKKEWVRAGVEQRSKEGVSGG